MFWQDWTDIRRTQTDDKIIPYLILKSDTEFFLQFAYKIFPLKKHQADQEQKA